MKFLSSFIAILSICVISQAQYLNGSKVGEDESRTPVMQTQEVLQNSELRKQAIDTDAARRADQVVNITSMGDQNVSNQIFGITSDLMPWLSEMGKGDPQAMQKLLLEAQSNGDALKKLYEKMPAAQQEKIKAVAQQIESLRGPASNVAPVPKSP